MCTMVVDSVASLRTRMHVAPRVKSDTHTHATQLCNACHRYYCYCYCYCYLLLPLPLFRRAVGWPRPGCEGDDEGSSNVKMSLRDQERLPSVSVSHLIVAAARDSDGMQQHTFGIGQGCLARPGRDEAALNQLTTHSHTHTHPALPFVCMYTCTSECSSSRATDSSFQGRRRCGGRPRGEPVQREARFALSPFLCPQMKCPTRKK